MNIIRQTKEEGVSLRKTFLIMLCVSMAITVLLLFSSFHTLRSFHQLSAATDAYIELEEADGVNEVYVRVDENKLYYVTTDGETGSVDIWE